MLSQSIVGGKFSSCIYSALFSPLKYLDKFASCFAPMHSACMTEECSIFSEEYSYLVSLSVWWVALTLLRWTVAHMSIIL